MFWRLTMTIFETWKKNYSKKCHRRNTLNFILLGRTAHGTLQKKKILAFLIGLSFITYAVPKAGFRCYIQNPSPRSDLQTFYEKTKKSCFEMTLYAFFITYAVPKAAVRCYVKTPLISDLLTFYEKNKKSCFEMTLYAFL